MELILLINPHTGQILHELPGSEPPPFIEASKNFFCVLHGFDQLQVFESGGKMINQSKLDGFAQEMLIHENAVYVILDEVDVRLAAYSLPELNVLWKTDVVKKNRSSLPELRIHKDRLIINLSECLHIYDIEAREHAWSLSEFSAYYGPIIPAGNFLVVGNSSDLELLDFETGEYLATFEDNGFTPRVRLGNDEFVIMKRGKSGFGIVNQDQIESRIK